VAAKRAPRKAADDSRSNPDDAAEQLRLISNLLALLAVKGESQEEKILTLAAAGFTTGEIADLIRTTANTVAVTKSTSKSKPNKKKAARKRAKTP
jgi:DNA-binding NarL/FixJ family response regulator